LIAIPFVWVLYRLYGESLPKWPWAGVGVLQVKEGDVMVHLAGILAFWMADVKGAVSWLWVSLLTLNFAMMGVVDRAGTLAFGAVMGLCLVAKPYHKVAWRSVGMLAAAILFLFVTNFHF